jgi:glycosyltransferase involved in cell wall biosynthesis
MRILITNFQDAEHPFAGGAEVHLHEVFGRLARRGHEVVVLCAGWRGAPARTQRDGLDIHRVGTRATFPFLARRYFARELRGHWDVVVEDLNKVPLRVHQWSDVPTVLLVHHLFGRTAFAATAPPIAATVVALEQSLARLYRDVPIVAVSESTARDLVRRGLPDESITVIPNGVADVPVDDAAGDSDESATPRLVYLGRLQQYKRVDVLLHVMRRLADANVRVVLDIVGDGARRASLVRLAQQLGVMDRVRFHGRVPEATKQSLLARATVHVVASEKEGWGLSVLEAGVHRVPTIATYVPGLRDSVIEDRTGRFAVRNDVADFADVVRRLLDDASLRARLGDGARAFARSHSWDSVADQMEMFLGAASSGRLGARPRVKLMQRDPFQHAPLPRNANGCARFGAQRVCITLSDGPNVTHCAATIGARDAEGRWPVVVLCGLPQPLIDALHAPHDVGQRIDATHVVWELWGWPTPPLAWIEQNLSDSLPGLSVVATWTRVPSN